MPLCFSTWQCNPSFSTFLIFPGSCCKSRENKYNNQQASNKLLMTWWIVFPVVQLVFSLTFHAEFILVVQVDCLSQQSIWAAACFLMVAICFGSTAI